MLCFPNAKINIGLNIVERRNDGFHNIETIFYPIPLCDALEVISADKTTFTISGIVIPDAIENNLVMRAYQMIKADFDLPELSIYLHKNIPLGAGLGGGSSDAASMIKLLNDSYSLNLTNEQMEKYASVLGSDCSFFIRNQPAFATQRGEILQPVELSLDSYLLVVIKPSIHISTREAYHAITPRKIDVSVNELVKNPIDTWEKTIHNDFESVMFSKFPFLHDLKTILYRQGAIYASMSGSGSALYGFFPPNDKPEFNIDGCFVWSHTFNFK